MEIRFHIYMLDEHNTSISLADMFTASINLSAFLNKKKFLMEDKKTNDTVSKFLQCDTYFEMRGDFVYCWTSDAHWNCLSIEDMSRVLCKIRDMVYDAVNGDFADKLECVKLTFADKKWWFEDLVWNKNNRKAGK